MDEAIRLLGSFAKYVQEEEPDVAPTLLRLAMSWAAKNGVPLSELAKAMQQQSDAENREAFDEQSEQV
jgi:hypothetical protein